MLSDWALAFSIVLNLGIKKNSIKLTLNLINGGDKVYGQFIYLDDNIVGFNK